jgi:uncharacterized cupredoxin-like copper-binding protein
MSEATETSSRREPPEDKSDMSHRIDRIIFRVLGYALLILVVAVVAYYAADQGDAAGTVAAEPAAATGGSASYATDEDLAQLASTEVPGTEPFKRADPTVTRVSDDLPPTRVWSYAINGEFNRGNGVSAPIVVNQGDEVEMTLFNGSSQEMQVRVPHSIDFHSSELNPETAFRTIAPGKKTVLRFTATHAGVFMYHCATAPVLQHTGSGMVVMMVVKPRDLPAVDREFWINQQEFYLGEPGSDGNLQKMEEKTPDAITFNGYAAQYQNHPIKVRRGERIRVYVLNSGPSIWSAFHVIGTVFDRTVIEGTEGRDVQTVNLAPSQGGIVEFTFENEGRYTFVTHSFADAVKGAIGVFETENPPTAPAMEHGNYDHGTDQVPASDADMNVTLGEFYVETDVSEIGSGEITVSVTNEGAAPHVLLAGLEPVDPSGEATSIADTLNPGETVEKTVELEPGDYEFFCNLPGHYESGQTTEVTVTD